MPARAELARAYVALESITPGLSDNRPVRRRVLLIGLWLLAAGIAVTLAFVAVGQVARGVVEPNVAALSRNAIDHELTATTVRPEPVGPDAPAASSTLPTPG